MKKTSLAKLYMEIRLGQDVLDNFVWTYTGNDVTKEDLDRLQALSGHIDTLTEAMLLVMSEKDITAEPSKPASNDGLTRSSDAK
jgi:hypothetical protein